MKGEQAPDDLIDAVEVAGILGLRQRNSVSTYQHRYDDFPQPVIDRGPRKARFWRRGEVLAWQQAHQIQVSS